MLIRLDPDPKLCFMIDYFYHISKVVVSLLCWYCMSRKSWPILHSNLLFKMGQDFLVIYLFLSILKLIILFYKCLYCTPNYEFIFGKYVLYFCSHILAILFDKSRLREWYTMYSSLKCTGLVHLIYCLSNKSWPILYNMLLFKMGQDFLDMQYIRINSGQEMSLFCIQF